MILFFLTYLITTFSLLIIIFLGGLYSFKSDDVKHMEEIADKLTTIQDSYHLPWSFLDSCQKKGDELDINTYFKVFNKIQLKDDLLLDYVFLCYINGYPELYVRNKNDIPITFSEYKRLFHNKDTTIFKYENKIKSFNYPLFVEIENSKLGYLEYLLLRIQGSQFYQFWHANYYDHTIIWSYQYLLYHCFEEDVLSYIFRPMFLPKALFISYEPNVEFQDSIVAINYKYFSKWEGIVDVRVKIIRKFPHRIISRNEEILLDYDCGRRF